MTTRRIMAVLGFGALTALLAWVLVGFATLALTPVVTGPRTVAGEGEVADSAVGIADVYSVTDAAELSPAPTDEYVAELWDVFVRTAGRDFVSASVSELRVGEGREHATMAYVEWDEQAARWRLGANLSWSRNHDVLVSTMIHEWAHIRSLSGDEDDLERFEESFWTPYGADAPGWDNEDPDVAGEFFDAHEGDFVTEYAATNVVEDYAESYASFVLEDRPAPGGAVAAKSDFFWRDGDDVADRDRLRAEFALG